MKLELRRLGLEDLELLLSLRMEVLAHVFAAEKRAMTTEGWERLREQNRSYYRRELPREGHIACLASVGDCIVGCGGLCLYQEMPSPDNSSGVCGYLMNIYTREAFRRQGVAAQVCRWLIDQAEKRGAEKIYLETSVCGKKLYQSLGFVEMQDYLKLERK